MRAALSRRPIASGSVGGRWLPIGNDVARVSRFTARCLELVLLHYTIQQLQRDACFGDTPSGASVRGRAGSRAVNEPAVHRHQALTRPCAIALIARLQRVFSVAAFACAWASER